ncbi:hypothetical protein PVAND_009902 [Polypedilum vanderplanki]|uniref:Proteasome assembly chaperone 1 n=1 Tax=Polypedilum vanderplanki TaxID=319348 RepID=A0A9J6CDZ1_POLVA|nr:hypothetical protein PVAND_009902 [Polypedilum vanderplanki]
MDLNFGEIIDQESRALQWKWREGTTKPNEINRLIVIEGINAKKIIETYVAKNIQPLCTSKSMQIYNIDNDVLCVAEEQDLNYYSSMTKFIEEFQIVSKDVILVSLQSLSEFKNDSKPENCLIRGINSKFNDIPALSSPNFISGVAAGVASNSIMHEKKFACYIIYVDIYDEESIKFILNHLQRVNLPFDDTVKIRALHHKSDLYM